MNFYVPQKYAEFLEKLSDYQLVKDSTHVHIKMLLLPRMQISMHELVLGCGSDSFLITLLQVRWQRCRKNILWLSHVASLELQDQ